MFRDNINIAQVSILYPAIIFVNSEKFICLSVFIYIQKYFYLFWSTLLLSLYALSLSNKIQGRKVESPLLRNITQWSGPKNLHFTDEVGSHCSTGINFQFARWTTSKDELDNIVPILSNSLLYIYNLLGGKSSS